MFTYGLTEYQIEQAKSKLYKNIDFMKSNGIELDGKFVPYADFLANSYMNSDRYIAELQHRAWSMFEYAKSRRLSNIFITLTLPSHWHKLKTFKNRLIKNKKFGGRKYICRVKHPITDKKFYLLNASVTNKIPFIEPDLDFSQTIDKYTSRNASKELSKMFKRILDHYSFKAIPRDNRCYFRVTEPHKDGTPHLHISLFIPEYAVDKIVNIVNRFFPAPLSKVEVNINKPVSYLMKYILKTVDDLRYDKSITNLTLWYLYHGISRFYTSHTLAPLEVYRKLNGKYDLLGLTEDYNSGFLRVYLDKETKQIKKIENDFGVLYSKKPVNYLSNLFEPEITDDTVRFEPLKKEPKPIDVYIDDEHFVFFNNRVSKPVKKPAQMNYFELYNYFDTLDPETCNYQHFLYVRNLCIDRGIINGEKTSLNETYTLEY